MTTYAPAVLQTVLGEPSCELLTPADRLQVHVRFGSQVVTVQDPAYCREAARVFLDAAYQLEAAQWARRKVAAQLAPLNAAGPVVPGHNPPVVSDAAAGPAARNEEGAA